MITHKVIDVIYINAPALFYGTYDECYEWKRKNGFGYKIMPISNKQKLCPVCSNDIITNN